MVLQMETGREDAVLLFPMDISASGWGQYVAIFLQGKSGLIGIGKASRLPPPTPPDVRVTYPAVRQI